MRSSVFRPPTAHTEGIIRQLFAVDPTPATSEVVDPTSPQVPPPGAWKSVVGAVQQLMQEPAPGLADAVYRCVLPRLQALVDCGAHDALTAEQIAIYKTPPGMCIPLLVGVITYMCIACSHYKHALVCTLAHPSSHPRSTQLGNTRGKIIAARHAGWCCVSSSGQGCQGWTGAFLDL